MADTFQQVIEVALKATNDPNLRTLLTTLRDLGATGDLTEEQLAELQGGITGVSEELQKLDAATGAIATLRKLSQETLTASRAFQASQKEAAALGKSLQEAYAKRTAAADAASKAEGAAAKATRKELAEAEREVRKLEAAYEKAQNSTRALSTALEAKTAAVKRTRDGLREAGVDTQRLSSEQARLSAAAGQASAALQAQVASARAQAEAARVQRERLAATDEAFRRQAQASRVSAEALAAYRARADTASASQEKLTGSVERSAGLLSRLRGVFAGLGAYLGFREAVQGTVNILELGDAAERARDQLAGLYGSQEAGERAFASLRDLAKANGLEFDNVLQAAQRLKAFGLDPLDGTMQALIDQNARLGGSQQGLEGIVLALGQAWAKQKLQGEEILQLVERGVPVWDLLSKATGKSVQELQKLSEAGKLGRTEISLLIAEIGNSAEGVAAQGLGRLSGLVQQLRDRIKQFFTEVANSGVLDFFKQRVQSLIAEFDALQKSGDLAAFAKRFSDAIISTAKTVEGAIRFVAQYSGAIFELAKAYAAVKVVNFVAGMAQATAAMLSAGQRAEATAKQVGGLRGAMGLIPAKLSVAFFAVGLEILITRIIKLRESLREIREEQRLAEQSEQRAAGLRSKLNAEIEAAIKYNEQFRDTQIKTSQQVEASAENELRLYQDRINAAARYYAALEQQARAEGDDGVAAAARAKLEEYRAALDEIIKRLDAFRVAKERGFAKPETQQLQDALTTLGVDAQTAGVKFTEQGRKITDAFALVAQSANATSDQIKAAFSRAIDSTSTTAEITALAISIEEAFTAGKISAEDYARAQGLVEAAIKRVRDAQSQSAEGFGEIAKASQDAARIAIAQAEAIRNAYANSANETAAKMAEAIETHGAASPQVSDYIKQIAEAEAKVAEQNKVIAENRALLDAAGDAGRRAGEQTAQGFAQAGAAALDAASASASVGDAAEETGVKVGGVISLLQQFNAEFGAISENARLYFVEAQGATTGLALSLRDVEAGIFRAADATRRAIAAQRAAVEGAEAAYASFADGVEDAALQVLRLGDQSEESLRNMAEQVRAGRGGFDLLDQASLDNLGATLDRAADRVRALTEEAERAKEELEGIASTLQDELDRRAGNDSAILERAHQEQLRRIEELAKTGGDSARQQAEQARALAEQNYQQELAAVREREAAQRDEARRTADSRIEEARRANAAIEEIRRPQQTTDRNGVLRIEVAVKNEQNSGGIFAEITESDLDAIARAVLDRVRRDLEGMGLV